MASQSQVLFDKESVYIHINVNSQTSDKDAHIPGKVYLIQKPEGTFIEWKAEEVISLDASQNDQEWAVIGSTCSVVNMNSKAEIRKKYNISFDVLDLKSFKRNAPNHGWAYIIFILKDGHPMTVDCLLYRNMTQICYPSHLMNYIYFLILLKFIKDPYTTTLGGFSKVTNFLRDVLIVQDASVTRPREEMADILQEDIPGMEISQQDEPGFEVVTKTKMPNRPEGVEPSIRVEVWKFLLGYYQWQSTYKTRTDERKRRVDDYFRMKLQWKTINAEQEKRFSLLKERKCLIEKDVTRTDRTHNFFEGEMNPNLQVLNDILMTYCMYNFDLGYVQGMSDLLSPILVVMENEVDAFWCFSGLMERLCTNFEMDQKGMKVQLSQIHKLMQFVDPELCNYLESHDSGNFYFCFRWLLIMFKREFSFPDVQRLWEVMWTDRPCKNFHLLLCLAILDTEKNTLMENKFGFTEILKHINDMCFAIHLQETLKKAEGIYLQLKQCKKLPDPIKEILGFEISPCSSSSSSSKTTPSSTPINRETTPKLELPVHVKENGFSAPSSGTGTAVTTPDDSSIEILPENAENGMNNFYN
ncbi:hypothetical protein KUTeg_007173 [Tegillarca granosa]|uniref:Rab-GAP TBC domain-containing protein n=1 Tax=Tegillarca granosa TaxID=220873 RepID=A0ABQ9FCG8_TEGGR|nr:hypothetical protein KUTeg_007173 [Tegillarca granosa]